MGFGVALQQRASSVVCRFKAQGSREAVMRSDPLEMV